MHALPTWTGRGIPESAKRTGHSIRPARAFYPMNKIKPYLGTAVVVLVVIVLLNFVKPMLPAGLAKYL